MIAVTGANGLLGSFIVRRLHEEKIPFVALSRENSDLSLLEDLKDTITWKTADVNDPISLSEAFEGVDGVIHAAAVVSFNPREKDKIFKVNIEGTRNTINAALACGVKRFLHVSSVAALGRQKDQKEISEENKWVDSPLNSVYGQSKYLAELEVFRGYEEGLSVAIINPSVILARANWDNSSARLFKYVWNQNSYLINGSINYVDVRDVASIAIQLYHSNHNGERFIINGGNTSFKIFFEKMASLLQKKAPSIQLNKSLLSTLAFLENIRSLLTGADPLISKETARLANTFFFYDNQKVKKALDFEFQTIDSTLEWCCSYYRQINAVKNN